MNAVFPPWRLIVRCLILAHLIGVSFSWICSSGLMNPPCDDTAGEEWCTQLFDRQFVQLSSATTYASKGRLHCLTLGSARQGDCVLHLPEGEFANYMDRSNLQTDYKGAERAFNSLRDTINEWDVKCTGVFVGCSLWCSEYIEGTVVHDAFSGQTTHYGEWHCRFIRL